MTKVTITDRHMTMKHGATRTEISDALSPLRLLLQPAPSTSKSFVVRLRVAGKPKKITLGTPETMTLADARTEARNAAATAKRGEDPAAAKIEENKKVREGSLLVEVVAARWLKHLERHRDGKTLSNYRSSYNCHVEPKLKGKRVDLLRRGQLQALVNELVEDGKPGAARTTAKAFRSFYAFAIGDGLIDLDDDPTDKLKLPADGERERVLDDREIEVFWSALDRLDVRRRAFFKLALLLGCRRGELERMARGQLDLTRNEWTIPSEHVKGDGDSRIIPLSPLALEALATLPNLGANVKLFAGNSCDSRGKARLDKAIAAELAERKIAEPFADFVVHDLRRSCASGLARCKVLPVVIESILGHESGSAKGGSVAKIYNRYNYLDEKREALTTWSAHVSRIVGANVLPLRKVG